MSEKASILRWAGGKKWLAPTIAEVAARLPIEDFCDPAAGSCEVALRVAERNPGLHITIGDLSPHLRTLYLSAGDPVMRAIFDTMAQTYGSLADVEGAQANLFASAREFINRMKPILGTRPHPRLAANLLLFNRTCFNGLLRVNKLGDLNTPWGKRRSVGVSSADIERFGAALGKMTIEPFDLLSMDLASNRPCLTYVDPPYIGMYDQYTSEGFDMDSQARLADVLAQLVCGGEYVITSNAHAPGPLTRMYNPALFRIMMVGSRHNISAKPSARGFTPEALIVSRNIPEHALEPIYRLQLATLPE